MKKTISLLAALMLIVMLLPATAMAYEAVTPSATLNHTLELTNIAESTLDGTITYSFSVGSVATEPASAFADLSKAVTGAPTISDLIYYSSDNFTDRKCTKVLPIDLSSVSFMEPGVYKWPVKKTVKKIGTDKDPSNNAETFYLYVYVTDTNGALSTSVIMTTEASGDAITTENKGDLNDSYPARTVNLSIAKNVTGNQGSKDQYFKFDVQLSAPAGTAEKTYIISGLDEKLPESAYIQSNTDITNPASVTLIGDTAKTVTLWMKHDKTAIITDLTYGTSYTITETAEGYEASYSCTEGTTTTSGTGTSVSDTSIQADTTVTFTNNKSITVPTGITLNTAAPVMGILLAMSLLAVLYIGKRKEYQV